MSDFLKRVGMAQAELKAPKNQYNSFGKYNYRSCEDILEDCICFIMDDDGEIGRENYADWLNKREVK